MKHIAFLILVLISSYGYSQEQDFSNWKDHEVKKYEKLKALAHYVNNKKTNEISKDTLLKRYIYFDYVLNDTLKNRKEKRIQKFDTLFSFFRKPIDSLGINNIDVKPIRFFTNHDIYKPFKNQLKAIEENVFVYFKKGNPNEPLKCLLFENETNKLAAWILLDQGGYNYFLTFNLF
ncbi:hypothetical protein [Pontimicrobium sp. MEBiC06410]